MSQHAHIIQQPQPKAAQLILLFHGADSDAQAMRPMGERLAIEFPKAMVVAVAVMTTNPSSGMSEGFQWFSEVGLTEENQVSRVAEAMPAFEACVAHWQQQAGVDASATALIGFAQGATMALESTKRAAALASRVFAISGRFATLPDTAAEAITIHFLHGKADTVMGYRHAVEAAHRLRDLGADITAEVLPFIGHEIHPDFVDLVVVKLSTHLHQRLWAEALKVDPRA